MAVAKCSKSERIRTLNDTFRESFLGGQVMLTSGVAALEDDVKAQVLLAVRQFKDFDEGNDPHGEHDFGSFDVAGERYFFKLDYFDKELKNGSEDSSDTEKTTRVLTIMRADEY